MTTLFKSWVPGAIGLSAVVAVSGLLVFASHPSAALAASCGEIGMPACPLQSFMRGRVAGPLSQSDLVTVATSLDSLSAIQPDPSWGTWSTFAKTGADAARKNDVVGLRAACKSCHDAWRPAYRKQFRQRPLP